MKARQEAASEHGTGGDMRAVVQIFPGSLDARQRSALASSLREKGLVPWMQRQAAAGMPQPSAEALLAQAEAERMKIPEQHGALPIFICGHGYGAPVAAALLHRLPHHFAGAVFWNMPVLPPLQRAALLARLRWEKFRLGSDVPSRVLRSSPDASPTIGLAIAALQLGRRFAADRLETLGKALPILNVESGTRFSSSTSRPSGQHPTLDLNDLNQDISAIIAEWVDEKLQG